MSCVLSLFTGQPGRSRLVVLCIGIVVLLNIRVHAQQPAFSVKDDIAMVRFNEPSEDTSASETDSDDFSPDGRHVAIVTTRGLLASDQIESTVVVFDMQYVQQLLRSDRPPQPRIVASLKAVPRGQQTVSYAGLIRDLRWSEDSRHIYFLGENVDGGFQLYQARTDGRGFHALTSAMYDIDRFDVAHNTVAYTATQVAPPAPLPGVPINRDALDATGFRSKDILFPGRLSSFAVKTFSMFILRLDERGSTPRRVPGYSVQDTSMYQFLLPFRLSPDGSQLASAEPFVGTIPASWEKFDPPTLFENHRLRAGDVDRTRPDNVLRLRRYTLTDLATGKTVPLVDAPNAEIFGYTADENRIAWSADSTRVLVTNVFFPSELASPWHSKPCAVASIDVHSHRRRCLYFDDDPGPWNSEHVVRVGFGRDQKEALVALKQDSGERYIIAFHDTDDGWRYNSAKSRETTDAARIDAARHRNVRVYLKQDLNDAPTLWASDLQSGRSCELWNPNPQLQHLEFGQASVYRWKDTAGRDWIGGLVKPTDYVRGRRYPLVIQMYAFREHQFLTDGTDPSAFAARELASVGFVVLQIRKKPDVLSDEDAQTSLAGYESAIRMLTDQGLVDPTKVGVVGFSWTCWYVINALIKAPKLFAVATVADGLDNSYMQYVLSAVSQPNLEEQMDKIRGGGPFGAGLERWVREAPGFHTDEVKTPLRIEAIGPDSVLQEWELYGSLYMQGKPVDLIYFPEGSHIHQRPLERLESQQGNVDWMRFWLQGYEDHDPAKRAEYERWRSLRRSPNAPRERTQKP